MERKGATEKTPRKVTSTKTYRAKNKAELKAFDPFDIIKCMNERANRPMMKCDLKVSDITQFEMEKESEFDFDE